ncbi:MAG: hypothetical protein J7619_25285 [Dyadobacter sp.]|uniref:hypothetical protein n=1 Tax=Dyadobacter sp. TaxID=1914288 RepID=UPI001B01C725|nr:hypothetical protein [Dyadobacter sp.]MBO9616032.1 hypothetical protein [Dyadobacter sp.]
MQVERTDYQTVKKLGSRYLNVRQLAIFVNDKSASRQAISGACYPKAVRRLAAFILTLKL